MVGFFKAEGYNNAFFDRAVVPEPKLSRLSSIGYKKKKGLQGNLLSPVHQFAMVPYIPWLCSNPNALYIYTVLHSGLELHSTLDATVSTNQTRQYRALYQCQYITLLLQQSMPLSIQLRVNATVNVAIKTTVHIPGLSPDPEKFLVRLMIDLIWRSKWISMPLSVPTSIPPPIPLFISLSMALLSISWPRSVDFWYSMANRQGHQ